MKHGSPPIYRGTQPEARMKNRVLITAGLWIIVLCANVHGDDNLWTTNGPDGGRIMTIAIHPDDNQHIMLGTVESGIYKTTNGGDNWTPIVSDVLDRTLRDIAYFPGGPDTVYAATARGTYCSRDAGESWNLVEFPIGPYNEITDVEIHPVHHNIIFAVGPWTQWRSSDGGAAWDTLNIPFVAVQAMRTDPLRPDTMYLITQSPRMRWTVFRSINIGLDWEVIHNDLDTNLYAMDIQIDPVNSDIIYVAGVNWNNITGVAICKTTNGGGHWFDITPGNLREPYIHSITISPFDHNTIYACSNRDGVLKTTDAGISWTSINNNLSIEAMRKVVVDPISGHLYLGTYFDGIYKSTDEGESWRKISGGIHSANCLDIALNPRSADSVYVAAHNGYFRTTDGGLTWETSGPSPPFYPARISSVEIDAMAPDFIVMSLHHAGPYDGSALFRSLDGGDNWECLESPIPTFYDLAISHAAYDRRLFVGTAGLYYSDDDGSNWQLCTGGLPPEQFYSFVRVSPIDPNRIFAVGDGVNLWRSTDRGENWEETPHLPTQGGEIVNFVIDPVSASVLYAGVYQNGLFKSTDGGDSWMDITSGLPVRPTYIYPSGLAINPDNSQNLLVHSYAYGMYMSNDGGLSWGAFNDGLPLNCGGGFAVFSPADANRIYFATMEASVWSINRTLTGAEEEIVLPQAVSLQAYPNPFNSATRVSFRIPQSADIQISIYNILGERVSALWDGPLAAGEHSLTWVAAPFPSGAYFVRLMAGGQGRTMKITLLK